MSASLYQQFITAKQQHRDKYARDLAVLLKVSEAELLHARVGHDAKRLQGNIKEMIEKLQTLGSIKAITRNEYCVHEHIGEYSHQHISENTAVILNPGALDLRLFLHTWKSIFVLSEQTSHGYRHSIQFFDQYGEAIHKIYQTEQTNKQAWDNFVSDYVTQENPPLVIEAIPTTSVTSVDGDIIEKEWRSMTDVHQFFSLLHRYQLQRQQAFRLVSDELAYQVDNQALEHLLYTVNEDKNPIMIFVANRGCVQIFTGKVEKVIEKKGWLNIFNPEFTLHIQAHNIHESWITRKPMEGDMVTSLELFAADGTQIAQLYGQRKEGEAEQSKWREQLASLPSLQEYVS